MASNYNQYEKTTWINDQTRLNETNMNKIEAGIESNRDNTIDLKIILEDFITAFGEKLSLSFNEDTLTLSIGDSTTPSINKVITTTIDTSSADVAELQSFVSQIANTYPIYNNILKYVQVQEDIKLTSTGVITPEIGYYLYHMISVENFKQLISAPQELYCNNNTSGTDTPIYSITFYDNLSSIISVIEQPSIFPVTIPEGTKYISICLYDSAKDKVEVSLTSTIISDYNIYKINVKTINSISILGSGDIDTKELYEVTYGVTSYSNITSAISSGKIPYCKLPAVLGGDILFYIQTESRSGNSIVFACAHDNYITTAKVGDQDNWTTYNITVEDTANKATNFDTINDTKYPTTQAVKTELDKKVNVVSGKQLSTEDYTTAEQTKLANIEPGAEVNVQPDWSQSDSAEDDYIKNKPTIGNGTLTIQKNGTTVDTFSANASDNTTINITVPTQASDINALPSSTKYCSSISLSLDTSTYVITVQLKDQDGNNLGNAQTVDLPLESVVVSGSYDSVNKKVVLTLKNSDTVEFSVADLVSGLQTEITSQNKLDSDLVDDTNQTNKFVTAAEKSTWNAKQDALYASGVNQNIKTINNQSPLGDGNISVQPVINSGNKLSADVVDDTGTTNKFVTATEKSTWNGKQSALVNQSNIKSINGNSLLGSGNLNTHYIVDLGSITLTDNAWNGTVTAEQLQNLMSNDFSYIKFTASSNVQLCLKSHTQTANRILFFNEMFDVNIEHIFLTQSTYTIYVSSNDLVRERSNALSGKQDTLTTSSVNDGTINKAIGFDSNGNLVKGEAGSGITPNPSSPSTEQLEKATIGSTVYQVQNIELSNTDYISDITLQFSDNSSETIEGVLLIENNAIYLEVEDE